MNYDKDASYKLKKCQICGIIKMCCQHHIEHRTYGEKIIWICIFNGKVAGCHDRVHNPTGFGLSKDWAYKNGYLVRHNKEYKIEMKKLKKQKCDHSKSYYNRFARCIICQYCGQKVDEIKFGKIKKKVK